MLGPGSRPRPAGLALLARALVPVLAVALVAAGCVSPAPPAPATLRQTLPPWDAPRDAVSYIEAAGLEPQPLDLTTNSRTVQLEVTLDGRRVQVPAFLGVDRVRSLQAVVHTHDDSGTLWLEGKGVESVTLGQLFTLWGVRLDSRCLGAACGQLAVRTDATARFADPRAVRLASVDRVTVAARSG